MTDLNKMFPELTEMDFGENGAIILPIYPLLDYCPEKVLNGGKKFLKALQEKCDCDKEENLCCNECWRRASKIVMEHYFGK